MRELHCVLLFAVCVFADERRTKLPYIADAVGNTLPRPSNVPATVGSPINLLNPDKYEFYTFDESGELVKRLMTLEEIQAIVAAGEETEGLVTYSNDNQPTAALNFSQPSYTKVHSVVTNVQNVLKAQMEAQKNKSSIPPTLDTPDVSNSWNLILPSIFGNTGVDIVPDKTSDSFITPETETLDFETSGFHTQSKEEDINKTTNDKPVKTENSVTNSKIIPSIISTTTNQPTTTSRKPTTKIISTITSTSTTPKAILTTKTKKIPTATTIRSTTTAASTTTTIKPKTTTTTVRPSTTSINKLHTTSKINTKTTTQTIKPPLYTTKETTQFEKINTLAPMIVTSNITEKTTEKLATITKSTNLVTSTLALVISPSLISTLPPKIQPMKQHDKKGTTIAEENFDKINSTTVTTQSVSPSTTISSTEIITIQQNEVYNKEKIEEPIKNEINNTEPIIPLFDVAQSISQIASDLGGNYAPLPTTSSFLENKKENNLPLESKESLEIDIPTETEYDNENNKINNNDFENYIKISTLDPQKQMEINDSQLNELNNVFTSSNPSIQSTTVASVNTIDPILSDSMGDMLSQVIDSSLSGNLDQSNFIEEQSYTTEFNEDTTTINNEVLSTTTMQYETTLNPIISDLVINIEETIDKKMKKTEETPNTTTFIPEPTERESGPLIGINNSNNYRVKTPYFDANDTKIQLNSSSSLKPLVTESLLSSNKIETTTTFIKSSSEKVAINTIKKNPVVKNTSTTNILNIIKTHQEPPKIDEFKKKIQKVNMDDKELFTTDRNNSWKLISSVPPLAQKIHESEKVIQKVEVPEAIIDKNIVLDFSTENQGLHVTTKNLGEDVFQFTELCNELAFKYWDEIIQNVDNKRSFVLSPYSITSMLAMIFMGARGATSGEMNDILRLDDMVTFNPHFTLKNISDSIETSSNSGVAVSAFIRELYSERNKGKILTFYKERAQHFYNGHVEEINFKLISDIIRRRTNLLVKRYTWGKIPEYIKTNSISMQAPLAGFSTNIFETDCTGSSVDGRDGEMYFVVSPNVRQRRLVPVPAVVYKNNFLAGYDPVLDATAAALGNTNSIITTLFLMPGQQGNVVNAEDIEALEKRFLEAKPIVGSWNRLLRTLLPRVGLELQIPRFSHKSMLNVSSSLKKMGLKELFDSEHADLGGLIGPTKELHLSDMMQLTTFATCGEGPIGEQHHIEEYPEILQMKRRSSRWATIWDEPRDYQRAFHDPHDLGDAMHLPLHLRPRQARLPMRNSQPARLKFDRPFLYFVRHNPSGMILYVGRYNPRLLP